MTISTTTQRVVATGMGTDAVISVPFKFYATSDLVITSRVTATGVPTTLTLDSHYSVAGGNGAVGAVTVISGSTNFPSSVTWTITRSSPETQTLDLDQNDAFPAESLEEQMDKLALRLQDQQEQINRCIRFPISDVSSLNSVLENSVDRGVTNAILGWTSDGEPLITTSSTSATAATTAYTLTLLDDVDAITARGTLLGTASLRSLTAATTIAVTAGDTALTLTGTTQLEKITGGTEGQRLVIFWAASATFNVRDTAGTPDEINLTSGQTMTSQTAGKCLSLISDGTDWFEISRTTPNIKRRSVGSGASIPVLADDSVLTITGVTQIDNFTGGQQGHHLTIEWAASATFDIGDTQGSNGEIHLSGHTNLVSHVAQDTLTLVRAATDDWLEVSRSTDIYGITTLLDEGTPTVAGVRLAKTGGTANDPITDFDDGVVGQTFTLLFAHSVTINDSAAIILAGGANKTFAATDTITLTMFDDQVWQEVSRSIN